MKYSAVLVGFCVAIFAARPAGGAGVITVGQGPGFNHSSIQAAVDAATEGDHIVVFPGTYTERVSFRGKNILLTGSDVSSPGVVATTIIDGAGGPAVVRFAGTEGQAAILQGFTIRNGGHGIDGYSCQATIRSNVIANNGLVGVYGCSGTVENNTIMSNVHGGIASCEGLIQGNLITNNTNCGIQNCAGAIRSNRITGNTAPHGAGLYWCTGEILGNFIADNRATFRGGGLAECPAAIVSNRIERNTAEYGGGLSGCDGLIRANMIAGNAAAFGGGLFECFGTIENNLILMNSAALDGGGMAACHATIRNCTIVGNRALGGALPANGGGLAYCMGTIDSCIIWGNSAPNPANAQLYQCNMPQYSCIEGWTGGGPGNTAANPSFVDPVGVDSDPASYADNDYSLLANSPCIDAGNPDTLANDAGLPPGLRSPRNDMGASGGPNNAAWPAVMPRSADLTGALVRAGDFGIVSGKPFMLRGHVANQGNLPCRWSFWVSFTAINKDTGWRGPLCNGIRVGPLAIGEFFDLAGLPRPRNAFGGIPVGMYTIEMQIDTLDEVPEWFTSNNLIVLDNCEMLPNKANLMVSGFDFLPEAISPAGGTPIQFFGQILNSGTQPTREGFWVEFKVAPADGTSQPVGYVCDSCRVELFLAPGEMFDLSQIVRTAYSLAPGAYEVGLVLDPLDAIDEQREYDNTVWIITKKLVVTAGTTSAKTWRDYK